jgi:two-component system phosphate regulon sensor histidine kinase PhoR
VWTTRARASPPSICPRLTERFYRVDPSRSRRWAAPAWASPSSSTSWPAPAVRLDIRSKLGEGTEVSVYLPRAPVAAELKTTENRSG